MLNSPILQQVQIRNYKNIASAVVDMKRLTVLVGPNGAGKSNFVDALVFVAESLNHSVQLAFANRGGIAAVRRQSGGHPTHVGMRFRIAFPDNSIVDYSFDIAAKPKEAFRIARERCVVEPFMDKRVEFEIREGQFVKEVSGIRPRLEPDRLALAMLAGVEEFRPVYDFLTDIQRYSVRPERLRELQDLDPAEGQTLNPDGSNAASVLRRLRNEEEEIYERICNLLSVVVPGVESVEPKMLEQKEMLLFRQQMKGQRHPWSFSALNMSDGTLRILGILLAVYQPKNAPLIAIEEPESTIHPAAADTLMDILIDGSHRSQVLITTHSPDILDNKRLSDSQILVVESIEGTARITPLTPSAREILKEQLYTPGELLRIGELETDPNYAEQVDNQLNLFGGVEP
ncbi:TPA: chromosome segregation protein SMC [Candidatus Poribacteria bacterium]|nr:chromosome segregation protein SMC [Candidatus Poribacteria bacterium]